MEDAVTRLAALFPRKYGPWTQQTDLIHALFEDSRVFCIDIVACVPGATVFLSIDDEQFDWWPALTWQRAEQKAAAL